VDGDRKGRGCFKRPGVRLTDVSGGDEPVGVQHDSHERLLSAASVAAAGVWDITGSRDISSSRTPVGVACMVSRYSVIAGFAFDGRSQMA
jgi:hypothetical protein